MRASTRDGTAKEEVDYREFNQILTFAPGDAVETFVVPIIGDEVDDEDRYLFLHLTDFGPNVAPGEPIVSTLTIRDDQDLMLIKIVASDPDAYETTPVPPESKRDSSS